MNKSRRVCVVQHVEFEKPGGITAWAERHGHRLTLVRPYFLAEFPEINEFDLFILLGGTFDLADPNLEWLATEKKWLRELIDRKKRILGICAGAQLIADVLGAKTYRQAEAEIGWHLIEVDREPAHALSKLSRDAFVGFHWHGETFELPVGARRTAWSVATKIQAFEFGSHVIAVQFHPEITAGTLTELVAACGASIDPSQPYCQAPAEMSAHSAAGFAVATEILEKILNDLLARP